MPSHDQMTLPLTQQGGEDSWKARPALILAVLAMASFLGQLDVWITNVGLPNIGQGVGSASLSDLSWVLNGYAIVFAALLVPAGRLADRFGRKNGFLLGMGVFVAASLGAALSGGVWVLVVFRALQAVGAALLTPASLGLVLTGAPAGKVERYVRIWFTAGSLSGVCGPVFGGLLVQASWRWLFLVNIPFGLLAIALAARLVSDARHEQDARVPDLLGGVLLIVVVGALALGIVKAPGWGWSDTRVVTSLAVAVVGLVAFLFRSARHRVPVVDLSLFRDRIFASANLAGMLQVASFGSLLLSSILWMQDHWHYSAIRTGCAGLPGPVGFAAAATISETLQRRFRIPAGAVAAVGSAIASAGILLFVLLLHDDPNYLSGAFPCWLLFGFGAGLALPAVVSSATVGLRPEEAATGSAIVTMSTQIGSVVGISVLVAVLGTASGGASLDTYRHAWLVTMALMAAAGVVSLAVSQKRAVPPR
ncbi:MFS transporter [Streptomyces sp. NPDC008092]|uniref:MFS transporter n=1 Tax=Streptomyces sp. NPDC008092 TaxID=3364808 RepID=UPI0036EAA376